MDHPLKTWLGRFMLHACPALIIPSAIAPNMEVETPKMGDSPAQLRPTTTEPKDDEFLFLSGKPYFHVFITKTHVKPCYQMVLPGKFHKALPHAMVPVVVTYRGKSWEMVYIGNRSNKRFDGNWKTFVIDNDLKIGDACVFELVECSQMNIKFRVQILKGDFPSELMARVNGETSDCPIVID